MGMTRMESGDVMTANCSLQSPSGKYVLTIDPSGALALRLMDGNASTGILWYVVGEGNNGGGTELHVQWDGNLVRYDFESVSTSGYVSDGIKFIIHGPLHPYRYASWSTETHGKAFGKSLLRISDTTCNIILNNENGGVIWSAKPYACIPVPDPNAFAFSAATEASLLRTLFDFLALVTLALIIGVILFPGLYARMY